MPGKQTKEQFIEKANKKHNHYYDYSLISYTKAQNKVKILCPKHGEFEQQPNNHLFGQGCIKCMGDRVSKSRKYTKEQWVERFEKIHGERYNYAKVKIGGGSGTQ